MAPERPDKGDLFVSDAVLGDSQGHRHKYNNRMIAMILAIKKRCPRSVLMSPSPSEMHICYGGHLRLAIGKNTCPSQAEFLPTVESKLELLSPFEWDGVT